LNGGHCLQAWVGACVAGQVESIHWLAIAAHPDRSPARVRVQLHASGARVLRVLCAWSGVSSHSHWILLLIIVQHVRQDILCVLQPFGHFGVVAIQGLVQRHRGAVALLVHVGNVPVLRVQQNFRMVLEVNLHDLVA